MLSLLNSASTSVIQQMMSTLGLNGFNTGVGALPNSGMGNAGAIGAGAAGNDEGLMGTWERTFLPELNSLIADANSYASPARIQQAMGAAESGVAQAMDQGQQNALRDLQSFGIDPSSGRYAQLDETARLQRAAAQAGAGNVAEQQVEAIGRALRSEAIQATAQLPSQAASMIGANAQVMGVEVQQQLGLLQAQFQRQQLAQQGQLAQEQLAASLIGKQIGSAPQQGKGNAGNNNSADQNEASIYAQMLAEDAKQANAQQNGGPSANMPTEGSISEAGTGEGGIGGGGPLSANAPTSTASRGGTSSGTSASNPYAINGPGGPPADSTGVPLPTPAPGAPTEALPGLDTATGIDTPQAQATQAPPWFNTAQEGAPLPADSTQLAGAPPTPDTAPSDIPQSTADNGAIPTMDTPTSDQPPSNSTGELGNLDTSTADNGTAAATDSGSSDTSTTLPADTGGSTATDGADMGSGDTGAPPPSDTGSGGTSGGDTGSSDTGGIPPTDTSSTDTGGGDPGYDDSGYAQGGPVHAVHNRMGAIPASMSPSGGHDTDDVPATLHGTGEQIRLNQGEFIIPRDVVGWRGEGYYQKDIEKARKEREGAVARPTMKPAIPVGGQQ